MDENVVKEAMKLQKKYGLLSASLLQRNLKIGYMDAREIVNALKPKKGKAAEAKLTKAGKAETISIDKKIPEEEELPVSDKAEEQEKRMAPKKAVKKQKESAEKVGGLFREGTALAYLHGVFEDEKPHKREPLFAQLIKKFGDGTGKAAEKEKRAEWRIRRFREAGEASGKFAITLDREEDTLQLTFGKGKAKVAKSKSEKKTTAVAKKVKSKKGAGKPASSLDGDGRSSKTLVKLIRGTLADGKDWTKNKMVDELKKKYEIVPQDTLAAIKEEIKINGISEEDGVLSLT